ncbi:MAG: DUF1624 domain-containing protein [Acidobacteria bacterium]|nr:DUF1624 domain-containing protein [Acidobacteriota bacterium]
MIPPVPAAERKGHLDWLRGVGVLVMIQGHVIDSWTRAADRDGAAYHWITFVGGAGGAPVFLFLAGVALVLAASSRIRRGLSEPAAAARALARGWQIFGLAFLFRLQSWAISGGPPRALLKVDILNVMGLSMVVAALLWRAGRGNRSRALLFAAATVVVAMLTPVVRASGLVGVLPDPIEWYLRPAGSATTFTLLPWSGFLLAGCAVGVWLDGLTIARERRGHTVLAGAGAALIAGGYAASLLPPLYAQTSFWTSSPTFFFIRLGILLALVAVAHAWNRLDDGRRMREFGRSSLFVYWIHVEIVYGVLSTGLHRRLPLESAYLAFVLFSLFLYGVVKVKQRVYDRSPAPTLVRTPLST